MQIDKKKAIYIILAIVLLIGIYYIYFKKKKKSSELTADDAVGEPSVTPVAQADDSFPLKKGKAGKRVEQAQIWVKMKLLKEQGIQSFQNHGTDGKWGDETEKYVYMATKRDNISEDYFNKAGMGKIATVNYK